jgi:hypothetical protein
MEEEEEQEKEIQIQISERKPVKQVDWDYKKILQGVLSDDLLQQAKATSLADTVKRHVMFSCQPTVAHSSSILWNSSPTQPHLYVTSNFIGTVEGILESKTSANGFLRIVDNILIFPSGAIMIVSGFEANEIVKVLREAQKPSLPVLAHMFSFRLRSSSIETAVEESHRTETLYHIDLALPSTVSCNLSNVPLENIAQLLLFSGETMYHHESVKRAIESILSCRTSLEQALELPKLRNLHENIPRSDLEKLCIKRQWPSSS